MQCVKNRTLSIISSLLLTGLIACGPQEAMDARGASDDDPMAAVIARGESLELPTQWDPPPGEPIVHHTSGFAKTLCSAVFITGLDWRDAAANVGGFTSPFDQRSAVVDTVVDFDNKSVSLTLGSGIVRSAKLYGSQGCITHPLGEDSIYFEPSVVEPMTPNPETTL